MHKGLLLQLSHRLLQIHQWSTGGLHTFMDNLNQTCKFINGALEVYILLRTT